MKFNFQNLAEVKRAQDYLKTLVDNKSLAEVKKLSPKRSTNQNSYLHLLLGAFGAHFGYSMEEAKHMYKMLPANQTYYIYAKNDYEFMRSSADLTKEDMTKTIDNFRKYSAEAGYPLPTADDQEWLRQLDNLIEQSKYYL